jgi:hypothetical protein
MTTKLQMLNDAKKKIESDETLTFDDVVQLVFHQLKRFQRGSTGAARTEISQFLLAAGRRAQELIVS